MPRGILEPTDVGCYEGKLGYDQEGQWVDDNLHVIIGARFYLLHSGDLAFICECLPAMERTLGYFIERRNPQGLFKLEDVGAHWYYDAITTGGINRYYNAFFYKAALDLAEMDHVAGRQAQARRYRELAESIKAAFNRVLWKEDAPGGPRYLDWIHAQGQEVSYFCDLCQWPPIAVGIASPEQARKIVATADARIAQLEKEHGYQGYAGLSALWPVPQPLNPLAWQTYGHLNGGQISVAVETSDDGFKSVRAQTSLFVRDGVKAYSLRGLRGQPNPPLPLPFG